MNLAALGALQAGDFENFLVASKPGGIDAQEARGQAELCKSVTIPRNIQGASRRDLEKIGFVFGKDADDLFVNCLLPEGWKKKPTNHSMWTDLFDGQGRKRGAIFYKAAFYDRSAHMYLECRFKVDGYADGSTSDTYKTVVTDCGRVIREFGDRQKNDYQAGDAQGNEARAWLDQEYPENRTLAYWDGA